MRRSEAVLAGGVAVSLLWELVLWTGPFAAGQSTNSTWWYVPQAVVVVGAVLVARWLGPPVRRGPVVVLAAVLAVGMLAVHLATAGPRDQDILLLYPDLGRHLLDTGTLPEAEYPPLAIVAFAVAELLGGARVALPLLVLPLLLLAWWRLSGASGGAPWIVACIALVPTIVVFWEIKYDAIPAALLVLGLVAARRERWSAAGVWFGLGAAAKWFPGLAVPVLAAALLARRRIGAAAGLVAASAGAFALLHLPFLGQPDALLAPYRFHTGRGIHGESLPYLPLRLFGLADAPDRPWGEATVPSWAPSLALALVAVALLALLVLAFFRPSRAVALAAAAPAVFLLGNRIFSAQFILPVAVAWAAAIVLTRTDADDPRRVAFPAQVAVVATANFAVWPLASPAWYPLEWLLFGGAAVISAWAFAGHAPTPTPAGGGADDPVERGAGGGHPALQSGDG